MYTNLQRASCLHQRLVSLALFRCYGGSYLFDRYLSLHTRNLNSICIVVILAQTLFLLCSWRVVELPHRLHSPRPKPQRGHLILQFDGREVEITADFQITHIFFIFLFFEHTRKLLADLRHSYYE